MSVAAVYVVFGDVDEALRIGRMMVEERLAACINVGAPCTSIYWWNGEVAQSDEAPALFKTSAAQVEALITRIAELHSYEVPSITAYSADQALPAFAEWVAADAR